MFRLGIIPVLLFILRMFSVPDCVLTLSRHSVSTVLSVLFFSSFFPSLRLPHSSCWSHCCPRWWKTGKIETQSEARERQRDSSKGGGGCSAPTPVHALSPARGRSDRAGRLSSEDLHHVPEEVHRGPGPPGYHWDLGPRGESSAGAEEAGKLAGTGVQLVEGQPEEEERRQRAEAEQRRRGGR